MQDHYYSKKLKQYFPTRLDCLLYAHDGRGFGHVSRTAAVGLALKRLYPQYRVLLITGSSKAAMMIGQGALDWIKLPSYLTVLKKGVSEGRDSNAGFYKSVLGNLRADMLEAVTKILKPRCVLVDHNPFGKRDELVKALEHRQETDSQWILGLRGIIGEDKTLWSQKSSALVGRHYREILWYGDSEILGAEPLARIREHFQQPVTEMGYVSRVLEMNHLLEHGGGASETAACTVSLPWLGESSSLLIDGLNEAIRAIGPGSGTFRIYVPEDREAEIKKRFQTLPNCLVEGISDSYIGSLLQSRSAIVYGGYNSLLDVVAAGLPSLVVLRTTRDREQQEHLSRLHRAIGKSWRVIEEDQISGQALEDNLRYLLSASGNEAPRVDCQGAEKSALHLHRILQERS